MDVYLVAQAGNGKPQEIKLEGDRITIGRDRRNNFHIDEDYISSRHAIITRKAGAFFIKDHESRNGTFVNGQTVSGDDGHPIKPGDVVKLGILKYDVIEKEFPGTQGIAVIPLSERKKPKGPKINPS